MEFNSFKWNENNNKCSIVIGNQMKQQANVSNGKCQMDLSKNTACSWAYYCVVCFMQPIRRSGHTKDGSTIKVNMLKWDGYCECHTFVPIDTINMLAHFIWIELIWPLDIIYLVFDETNHVVQSIWWHIKIHVFFFLSVEPQWVHTTQRKMLQEIQCILETFINWMLEQEAHLHTNVFALVLMRQSFHRFHQLLLNCQLLKELWKSLYGICFFFFFFPYY